ncbi:PH domain-containing protein [Actinotalea sp.]|uniref:PH domain-containing protein n=1 Tax=Actinotalea sp. TaxID=1872145 RepID=UPI002BFEA174|nr:PH domain-containing protein [Actinotalea sp.]HRA50169.1 PH domain-containing protein [Actinotalea sp.]
MSADLVWSRVHPVTPAVKGWKVLAVLLAIVVQQVGTSVNGVQEVVERAGWGPIIGAFGVAVLIGFGYAGLAWRMTRYAVDAESVYLQTGVLFRQQRTARLDRIQGIAVVKPLLARLLGLAELRIEVAGAGDSAVQISYLREDAAQRLRNGLLARAAGVDFGTVEQPEAPEAPERELIAVSPTRLVASLVRSIAIVVLTLGIVGVVGVAVGTRELGALFTALPALLGAGGYLWGRFAGEFDFRVAQSPDGLRLRHGLLESRAQTVPPGRVQAVRLTQPLLWRRKDWWRVESNIAGFNQSQDAPTQTVLLPVGDRAQALLVLWLVLPDLGVADPRAVLEAALVGTGSAEGFVTSPRRARPLDPWSWRRNGYVVTEHALLVRRGRWVREVLVVPHARLQSLGLHQGPLQRRLGLASVALHSTPGPITPRVAHLDAAGAGELVDAQAVRARLARAGAGPERWMRGPASPVPAATVQTTVPTPPAGPPPPPAGPPVTTVPPPPPPPPAGPPVTTVPPPPPPAADVR